MISCYYKILGVSIDSGQEEIKTAFRRLALRWHPDRHPQDDAANERFRRILEAYENLVDGKRRRRYDRLKGYDRIRRGAESSGFSTGAEAAVDYISILEEAFGIDIGRRSYRPCGPDVLFELQLSG
ncbi:MAG: molecular chaperone DnaJ, partial [Alphaproteobacteria bacterium]